MVSSGTDEPDKLSSSHYDSTSPTQPLLSKPYRSPSPPSPSSSSIQDTTADFDPSHSHSRSQSDDQNQYPLITFNYGPRHFRDLTFLFLFLLFLVSTFAFGIFSVFNRNPNSSNLSSFVYDPYTTSCVKFNSSSSSSSSSFLSQLFHPVSPFLYSFNSISNSHHIVEDLIWTLLVTLILSGPFVLALLCLLRRYAKQIVYTFLPFFVLIPIFINVYWFVACTLSPNCSDVLPLTYRILLLLFVFLIIGIIVWIIVVNWHRIELTVMILGVASDALAKNLGLFVVLPCLTLALLVYFVPIVVFLVFARLNGKIVPQLSSGSDTHYTCAWKQDSWVPAYYALAIITMLWSAAVMVEAQVFVTSGTVAQWYFSKDYTRPSKSIRSSLRHAFGPSFGTVCFSGLLIFVVRAVRAAVDSVNREEGVAGIVNLILRCCVNVFLSAIDFLNKFTINFAAITGEGYCSSAKMTYELLKRNLLSAVFVETVSTRILGGIIFVLSSIYAIAACAILKAVSDIGADAYFVAALAWLLLILVLSLFVHVLDNVIDTVYVCYAIDRDKGEVCKQDVHNVYVNLPISRNNKPSLDTRTPLIV